MNMMSEIYNSTNPDLSKFKARGGKLLMYQGWADAIVTPAMTVDYYEAVERKSGGREGTQDFLRLFMLRGVDHCGLQPGPGADQTGYDPITALEQWVEHDVPPALSGSCRGSGEPRNGPAAGSDYRSDSRLASSRPASPPKPRDRRAAMRGCTRSNMMGSGALYPRLNKLACGLKAET